MKKLLLFAVLLTLLVSNVNATVNDSSYFAMGVNDTLYIDPQNLEGSSFYNVNAHFESRFDSWIVWMDLPQGLSYVQSSRNSGMNVPYVTSNGTDSVFMAALTVNYSAGDSVFASSTTVYGYWDPDSDGVYTSYGLVKWEPGDYEPMFRLKLEIDNDFRQGYISIMGHMTATEDLRGGTGDEWFSKTVFVKVGYRLGDANGDGHIDVTDVSMITNFVMGRYTPDEFQFEASDINGDGDLGVDDVAILIRWVLGAQGLDGIDLSEYM